MQDVGEGGGISPCVVPDAPLAWTKEPKVAEVGHALAFLSTPEKSVACGTHAVPSRLIALVSTLTVLGEFLGTMGSQEALWCHLLLLVGFLGNVPFAVNAAECNARAEIAFLLDSSEDMGETDFKAAKELLASFVRTIEDKIDSSKVRIAAVTFTTSAELQFNLADCPFADDLVGQRWLRPPGSKVLDGCLGKISYTGGRLNTGAADAFRRVGDEVFTQARRGVSRIAVVMSKRFSDETSIKAEVLRLHSKGVKIIPVRVKSPGVGKVQGSDTNNGADVLKDERFETMNPLQVLLRKITRLFCKHGKHRRVKRSWWDSYDDDCPDGKHFDFTAEKGETCVVVDWTPPDDVDRHSGGNPGECFEEGDHRVEYVFDGTWGWSFINGDECTFTIRINVIKCDDYPSLANAASTSCTKDLVYGSVCSFTCDDGYRLTSSPQTMECQEDATWSNDGSVRCRADTPPNLGTCRVSVTDSQGNNKNSSYTGTRTDCDSQRDEFINTQPTQLYFVIKADLDMALTTNPYYVSSTSLNGVGIVGAKITLIKVSVTGTETSVREQVLDTTQYCQQSVSDTNPLIGGALHDCEGTLTFLPSVNLKDGESLCADMEAFSGGFYDLLDERTSPRGQITYRRVSKEKRVCFTYDESKPVHCSETSAGCQSEPLQLSTRRTRTPQVTVHVEGWVDPIPPGGSEGTASKISKYRLEENARSSHTIEWDVQETSTGGPFDKTITLPEEGSARLYAVILEVHDHAGNVAYARRLILYDNSSYVQFNDSASLTVVTAEPRSGLRWQTDVSTYVCVDWKYRFYNTELYHNNFLLPVNPDTGREILGHYDQQSGILPVTGTDNVHGIVKFEMAWQRDYEPKTSFSWVSDVYAQTTCVTETLLDGETYDIWIRATDIMENYTEDTVRVSIDHTDPVLNIVGLRGRFDRDGLYVHNTSDLSTMKLMVNAEDPHSAIKTLTWTLDTRDPVGNVGSDAVGVQQEENATVYNCFRENHCYCPSVGVCEISQYLFTFNILVDNDNHEGQHHRHYYITVTATNYASLQSTETIEILVDESPPTVGMVLEGLSDDDRAEMDFTSSDVVHVRWHGFLDHESGILLYRVVLADRCLTDQEMDATHNATEVEQGEMTSFRFPSEGHYFTTVVAYNRAMEPSGVACSDGITYDTTKPRLVNVSITHARTGQEVACTHPDQPWLVNNNMTRVRLARTSDCLNLCSANSTAEDVGYLPISSNHTLGVEASDEFCRTLPMMTEYSYIVLPSDYLKLTWAAVDAESEMEEYHVGMGRDRTTASAPDLLPFTPTHGHHSYHARHSGLGHGAVFFIFLRALSKAGLQFHLTLGPLVIDETPPEVTQPLAAVVDGDSLSVSWTENTFTDPEQPDGVGLGVTFRVGYDHDFVTEFLPAPESSFASCQGTGVTRCVRYPLSDLYPHDTESGRRFFFQLHATNAAGHVTSVNTSSVLLPAHLPPSHAVIFDVINETSAAVDTFVQILEDVDVIVQREEVCMAWHGLYHEDEVNIEVGLGTNTTQDDLISFRAVQNTGNACVDATSLPVYSELFSVVRATSPGGSTVFSSDGFHMVPKGDPINGLQVFNGIGCTAAHVAGSRAVTSGTTNIALTALVNVSLHAGDILFLKFTPFIQNVVFPDTVLLQRTLTGYQVVLKSSNATVVLPASLASSALVEVMTCLKDAALLPMPEGHVTVTWELAGPWTNLVKRFKVELTDETCLGASQMEDEYDRLRCLLDEKRVGSATKEVRLRAEGIIGGHEYVATVAPCFDNACLSAAKSSSVTYSSTGRSVVFRNATILAQSSRNTEVKINAEIVQFPTAASSGGRQCVFRWMVARDQYGTIPITDHHVGISATCSSIEIQEVVDYTGAGQGSLYVCLQPVFPWRADNPTCHRLVRPGNINHVDPFHVIELPHTTLRQTDFGEYLHSHQLGSRLHELYDLDLDFARSDVMLSAVVTFSEGRTVTWFLMTNPHVPTDGSCAGDAGCLMSLPDKTETVTFPRADSELRDGHVYFICARLSPNPSDGDSDITVSDLCGDGVVIDDSPPEGGTVVIGNANNGYVVDNVVVTWSGFSDVETRVSYVPDEVTLNYSVALGSYPKGEDLAGFVSVGQRTSWTFQHLNMAAGATCIATVRAEDRLGHVTEIWSESVIVDNTPPTVGHVAAGETTRENFVAGPNLPVRWEGVLDEESGIQLVEIAVGTEGGDDVIPFEHFHGNTAELAVTSRLLDGHSYVVLLKAVNGAGLTTMTSSEPFILDSSPPGPGQVWNSAPNTSDHGTYSSDVGVYRVYWAGFSDPHSGLDYYRVGLGSQPGHTDIHPFVYVGLQTSFTWRRDFEQGKQYYVTVEACNKAGLCRVTSSSSMTFDDSPPLPGHVTVGFDGRHSKYHGHNTSLPVQWIGFSDPQTGIQEYWWCVGTTPETCDVIPVTQTFQSRATVKAGLTLPVATPLYVTVRARNPAGLDTVSVSDSFTVDPTPPEVVTSPHFLLPRDGSPADSQWDRSVLRLAWRFVDSDSPIVSHTINIRSRTTGRLVTDAITIGSDTELILTLDKDHLLLDGDSHWVAVSACNAAGLCTTSISDLLLVDSTPPVVGTFLSPLTWTKSQDSSGTRVLLDAAWHRFADAESGIAAYYMTAGRQYNGEELSNGQVMILHDNTTQTQRHTFPLSEDLEPGDVVYLTMWAENSLGLHSPMLRMAFDVLQDSSNGASGSLEHVRHSCAISYCTGECTCAPTGQVCKESTSPCQQYNSGHPSLFRVSPYIGLPKAPQAFTTSAKCLEGHWELSDPALLSNVSRFEWSFSLANKSEGEGIFSLQEAVWHDVGRNTSAVHCMPGKRVLKSGQGYILHVRAWLSSHEHVTFISSPVMVDHTPPQVRRGRAVIDSDVTCSVDVDYVTTEPSVTACWDGVFRDAESQITQFEVWFGTSVYADDHVQKFHVGLNTSWSFPTSGLERGTRYYVTVRAVNGAGLMTTAVSDGVTVDVTPPVAGVVFAATRYTHLPAQTSTTTLPASWHGFQDAHSGVTSYYVTLNDVTANSTSLMPFRRVGTKTEYTLGGLNLEHNHR
ncbi:hypothetical protein BaRGS_00011985 [Batillaria attramentaria]|uniref:Uncharacterized protein n=1 Tax=Batillaria attramentaria TaxID=370345 RepID=A0ABD0LBT0_9CAEN